MRIFNIMIILLAAILVFGGCSKNQEEAEQLEQEMLNQKTADSMIDSSGYAVSDSSTQKVIDATAIPTEESRKAMPAQPAGNGFTVQVAGCEDEAYASYLVDKYSKRGYEPFVSKTTVEGQLFYRVRIGVFENYSAAVALQKELEDKYSITAWVDVVSGGF